MVSSAWFTDEMSDDALIRRKNLKGLGLSPGDLVSRVGKSYQYWRDLMETNKSFGEKAARNIEEKLNLARGQLDMVMFEEGNKSPVVIEFKKPDVSSSRASTKETKPEELVIPQFDTGGSMGRGLLLRDQPGVIQGWQVSHEWVSKNIKSHSGAANLCIVTGFGDSMKGMFNSGDPIVVDTGIKSVDYDAVYFFRVDDEGFIKRLQRIPGEGLRVLSENKQYDSWTIKPGMDFEVFGRVVKAWQGEDF